MIQKVQKNIDYSYLELNELEYEEAIQLDKRTFPQLYWATIQREHIIFYIFVKCNDFSLLSIKLIRLIFLIVTNMALNALIQYINYLLIMENMILFAKYLKSFIQ